ncbi:HdeD family acid-resistance protein [Allopusillimonas ginsengisoli]|uniref:HdeD family acid-resistance protein n=1 Tax=Allopusillimonas ginsengisoli TaxID=453575 RepID=UPI0010225D73|nr:HdeD family acid-resistance protein [Allopusillimonas ginsengisoli]TEA77598.1 HdeD family acid-resistance protein [Allopusillimonas ginsengisoli]
MNQPSGISPRSETLATALSRLGAQWGWFMGLGAVLVVLGLAASVHVLTATLISVLFVGLLMLAGGILELVHAWRVQHWSGFLFWSITGVLYAGAGALAIINPAFGASILTLMLGAVLIATGALRLWIWFNNRTQRHWQWLALSGTVTLLAGLVIAVGWPGNSVWVLGLVLAIDLLFQGWTLLFVGLALRRLRQ